MSQYFHEFSVGDKTILYPHPLLARVVHSRGKIIFEFSDAVLLVQGEEKDIHMIERQLVNSGFFTGELVAQLLDTKPLNEG